MSHWSDKYIQVEYKDMNCSKFVEHILRDHFGKDYSFPQSSGNIFEQSNLIKRSYPKFTYQVSKPEEGDLVIMNGMRNLCHVGIYVKIGITEYVLHTESTLKTAALHSLRDLLHFGYSVASYHRWQK